MTDKLSPRWAVHYRAGQIGSENQVIVVEAHGIISAIKKAREQLAPQKITILFAEETKDGVAPEPAPPVPMVI
jgi:hypothetical protein